MGVAHCGGGANRLQDQDDERVLSHNDGHLTSFDARVILTTMGAKAERKRRAQAMVGSTVATRWRLDGVLGVGGMATVHSASDAAGTRVAIKMLHPELSREPEIRERFLREAYVANRVAHPDAVAVIAHEEGEDGTLMLVMPLLEGETVHALWRRRGRVLKLAEVCRIGDHVLNVLTAAHAADIVHRDIKPENMFLTLSGAVKVLDFGIARARELASATVTGTVMGTPGFMPPEQARGQWSVVDARSDVWAVGATMYALLSGKLVHERRDSQRTTIGGDDHTRRADPNVGSRTR